MEVRAEIVRLQLARDVRHQRASRRTGRTSCTSGAPRRRRRDGEASPIERYGETAESALAFVERQADWLGDDPFALEEIGGRLREVQGEQAAKAAVDAALHDLRENCSTPGLRLLGLPSAGPPTSWTVWLGDPDDMARRAEAGSAALSQAEAEARRRGRTRRRARPRRARRHRAPAPGRRQRVVGARRGARRLAAARRARRRVRRAAAAGG